MMNRFDLMKQFSTLYGSENDIRLFFAPGRVNLIGEHIDYNGGLVFPCALDVGTTAVVRKRNDRTMSFASMNFIFRKTVPMKTLEYDPADSWVNYPKGIVRTLMDSGFDFGGFDVLYYGNIPNGSGLSSSASIEMLTAVFINGLYSLGIPMIDMVKLSKKSENEFIGVNCGIMDMFAIGMGKKDTAISLDCNTLEYRYIPLLLDGYSLVISNTNKKRGLADSKYNERRSECEKALSILRKHVNAKNLCEISVADFELYGHYLDDPVLLKRVRHVISENLRVRESVALLSEKNDIAGFGDLMNRSHDSLRDDFEVTGFELDTIVEESRKVNGVLGSRMTGGGFGGCAVSIVKNDSVKEFTETVGTRYREKTGYTAEFYKTVAGDGAGELLEGKER